MIIAAVRKITERACRSKKNFYGYSAWTHHVVLVEKYGLLLAKKLKADREIVQLACLLHDHASIVNKKYYAEHHQHSARLAGEILTKLKYPPNKIKLVQDCILTHRGSRPGPKESLEAKILADADAMAHFDVVDDLFLLAYQVLKLPTEAGREYVMNKLERSYRKMTPIARSLIKQRYQDIKKVF